MFQSVKKIFSIFQANITKIVLVYLGLSFFIGLWHGFPLLNIYADEMLYVGGALRAIEHHTIIPAFGDVPYGTITYFLNYILSGVFLLALLPFFKFSLFNLKIFLIQSAWVMYLPLRFLSFLVSLVCLYFFYQLLKKTVNDLKTRLFLLILFFSNIITIVVLHSGKMWVLSTMLLFASFYFLYSAMVKNTERPTREIFLSVLFAFLAFANFQINFFALINIPILLYYFRKNHWLIKRIALFAVIGLVIFAVVIGLNIANFKWLIYKILFQDPNHSLNNLTNSNNLSSVWNSFLSNISKIVFLFPLSILVLLIAVAKNKTKNKNLFVLSVIYFLAYFVLLPVVASWTADVDLYLRYLFPIGFFLVPMIASFDLKFKKVFYYIGAVAIFCQVLTLYYLAIPTTYNQAYNWIVANFKYKDVLIYNEIVELQLPQNKQSALAEEPQFCGSKCQNIIKYDLNKEIKMSAIDRQYQPNFSWPTDSNSYYLVTMHRYDKLFPPIKIFSNGLADGNFFSPESSLGNYFYLDYYKIKRLGASVYIYKVD